MFPERHLKDEIRSDDIRKKHFSALLIIIFAFFLILGGPVLHELSHVAVLELFRCSYEIETIFSLRGLHGFVRPFCTLGEIGTIIFYLSGYFSTIILGLTLSYLAFRRFKAVKSYLLIAAGTGFLMSVLLSIGSENDIHSTFQVLHLPGFLATVASVLMALAVSAGSLLIFLRFLHLERKKRE